MNTLACKGGTPAVNDKLPHWPSFDEAAIKAVEATLRSGKVNYWTGKRGMEFEKRFADWQGSKFAISTTNGTSALHVGLTAMGFPATGPATAGRRWCGRRGDPRCARTRSTWRPPGRWRSGTTRSWVAR